MQMYKYTLAAICGAQIGSATRIQTKSTVTEYPSAADRTKYPEWASAMEDFEDEYGWQPYEVTTDDGYILTLFKVFKRGYTGETGSILFQQGYGQDATSVLEVMNDYFGSEKHHWFKAIDAGYDVWFNNFRGTRYSLGHVDYDYAGNDAETYWSYTFAEMGIYDAPAAIQKIYEENGGQKIDLINQSNATTAMHYGLAYGDLEETFFADRLNKVIQLTPCNGVVN